MSKRKGTAMRSDEVYNTSVYMARLVMKNPATMICAGILCAYAIVRVILSISVMTAQGSVIAPVLYLVGSIAAAAGLVLSIVFSKNGGDRYQYAYTSLIAGTLLILAASVVNAITLSSFDISFILQCVFIFGFVMVEMALKSASKGDSASPGLAYLPALAGIVTLLLSAITFITYTATFRACLVSTYNWEFFAEDFQDMMKELVWFVFDANPGTAQIKSVFYFRFIERIFYLLFLLFSSLTAFRMVPYIKKERMSVEFAQEAGGFSVYDGDDFRTITKKRARESFGYNPGEDSFGIGSSERAAEREEQSRHRETNEYGDYVDEETGIYYYFDAQSGRYYYLDEVTGEYVYKKEKRRDLRQSRNPADIMPWDLDDDDDDEDNIYRY